MRDVIAEIDVPKIDSTSYVPIDQILDSRTTFPDQQLSFEVLLEAKHAWQGLELCAQIARLGLPVTSVVYRRSGHIFGQFQDDRTLNLLDIAALFANAPQVTVSRWTTVLSGGFNLPSESNPVAEPQSAA